MGVHPLAVVDPKCRLGDGVDIGPGCVLTGEVTLGEGVRLVAGVHVCGPVRIGAGTILYPGACIGFPAQDYKFTMGMPTGGVTIGCNSIIREHVTVHAATRPDVPTTICDKVFMMACSHAGHDARVGNGAILVNSALLAGHAELHDNAIMSGNSAIHQFCRIGRMAFLSGNTGNSKDIPPFCISGSRNRLHGLNLVGLRRGGVPRQQITGLRRAFWEVLRPRLPLSEVVARLGEMGRDNPLVAEIAKFVAESKRGICPGAADAGDEAEMA